MKYALTLFFFVALLSPISAQDLSEQFDKMLSEQYKSDGPGVAALVAKDGQVVYKKAFGMANLELRAPMNTENVFELGSITKQFTAVGILMLQEQGKLNVQDEITKFLPDYPTHGKTITIHHLLNHTSGIKSYTEMGNLREFGRLDKTPIQLIDHFKSEPMDFDPGAQWHYNNSGYVILGYIIEKASGMSYEEFINTKIFKPLGMKNSFYGSKTRLINNRASGYMPTQEGYRNADFLSMTLPYAAGSLMSCVDDMLLWSEAVHNNTLISAESKSKAFTNTALNDGKPTYYGYGWQVNEINGTASIEHGGGIFGYVTQGVYIPSENVYVILLTNTNGNSPQDLAIKMTALAIGKGYPENEGVALSEEQLKKWVGNYEFEGEVLRSITYENGSLFSQREGSDKLKLFPISETRFYFDGSLTYYDFLLEDGKKVALFADRIQKAKGMETDKKAATEKKSIVVAAEVLEEYVGVYELQPGFQIEVATKEGKIYAQATGQSQVEIFAEAEDTFFLKVVAAQLVFERNEEGKVMAVRLRQGGQELRGEKKS